MATRMQQRRGTAQQWTDANPILAAGEIGFETDTGKFKMGNGSSAWSALSYFTDSSDFDTTSINNTINSTVSAAIAGVVAAAPRGLKRSKIFSFTYCRRCHSLLRTMSDTVLPSTL